jgi:hypothetical protein
VYKAHNKEQQFRNEDIFFKDGSRKKPPQVACTKVDTKPSKKISLKATSNVRA